MKIISKTKDRCLIEAYDGKIYVGTKDDRGYLKGWWAYDIAENTWTRLLDFAGTARCDAVAKGKMKKRITDEENEKEIDGNVLVYLEQVYYWMAHLPERYEDDYETIQKMIKRVGGGNG